LSTKLDPSLAMIVELAQAGDPTVSMDNAEAAVVSVMVALSRPASGADLARLTSAGLTVRSEIGDILTGTIPVDRLEAVAADPNVVAIEGSRPMAPELGAITE